MKPQATDAHLREVVMTRGAGEAVAYLSDMGYAVGERRAAAMILKLVAAGLRDRNAATTVSTPAPQQAQVADANIRFSSDALLRAHLRTGKHWITDPVRFAEACASVGLAA